MCIPICAKLCEQRPSKTCLARSLIIDVYFVALIVLLFEFKNKNKDIFPGSLQNVQNIEMYTNVQLEHYLILYVI